jgi:lipoprotein
MKTSPTKRHLQTALALTLLTCSGLTGCSEGQEQNASSADSKTAVATAHTKTPSATPKASSKAKGTGTPSATASPTATLSPELEAARKQARDTPPPPKPELITINSEDGAIATAKYWLQLYYYTYISGNTSQYKELCPGSNQGCAGVIREATKSYAEGGWLSPVNIKLNKVYRRDDLPDSTVIQINYEHNDFDQYRGDGSATHYDHAERGVIVELSYQNNHWTVIRQKNEKFD